MITSSKPGKQRVHKKTAPKHERRKMMSSILSKELREKNKKRNLPVRKGDNIIVMKGSFKGTKAKVESISRKDYKVYLEGINKEKKNGTKIKVGFDASKLMIIGLSDSRISKEAQSK